MIAFFFDKNEYADEINMYEQAGLISSSRINLRLAQVTDPQLIKKLKKKYPVMFLDIGMSLILLKRYDGSIAKLDLTALDIK